VIEIPVPCTFDFNVAITKYIYGLEDGELPLSLLFSGTVFHASRMGLQIAQIPWDREASYKLPVSVWKEMMEQHDSRDHNEGQIVVVELDWRSRLGAGVLPRRSPALYQDEDDVIARKISDLYGAAKAAPLQAHRHRRRTSVHAASAWPKGVLHLHRRWPGAWRLK
jgi:hypothetical protein